FILTLSGDALSQPTFRMAHEHHRSSLEDVLDFNPPPQLAPDQRIRAKRRFFSIINHFNTPDDSSTVSRDYNRPLLVLYTYEYALSELSQDTVLTAFFDFVTLPIDGEEEIDFSDKAFEDALRKDLIYFADLLLDNFFLPLKAAGQQTQRPSPAPLSAIQRAIGGDQEYAGTPDRLSVLRGVCLIRDHYRCVISRQFDSKEALRRLKRDRTHARDDEGNPLQGQDFATLEVAHILPHALMKGDRDSQLDRSKKAALDILNMFDNGVVRLIEGNEIDRPFNAMTLSHDLHVWFGSFEVYFEEVLDERHTYRIKTFVPEILPGLPVTRTLLHADNRTIDPPLPRLLAIHRAIAMILHLSAAGEYIDKILRDMEDLGVHTDGSTDVGRLVMLRLGDWITAGC
ncbi:hypothetical protein LOZ47_003134, partial [Ophidiomyces ophidiicola]